MARSYSIPIRPYTKQVVTLWYRAPEILLGSPEYSTPVDVWAIGCIFWELITKSPLFAGDSELDQIYRIFRILGTPTEEDWAGIKTFENYKSQLPSYSKKSLKSTFGSRRISDLGVDLLERMLIYDPSKRITAKSALQHPYFN